MKRLRRNHLSLCPEKNVFVTTVWREADIICRLLVRKNSKIFRTSFHQVSLLLPSINRRMSSIGSQNRCCSWYTSERALIRRGWLDSYQIGGLDDSMTLDGKGTTWSLPIIPGMTRRSFP
ncbi:hypothetical protein CDAR_467431 [Caerostris darwini]|uniref:Uncharacterized protein n=1 Tax=Caerostris darwini TaxID=1538125 RepID=A0AAV4RSZ7_9ARAC|nr:hypothetical protein CDAR_467431 [Caerostris darwini]